MFHLLQASGKWARWKPIQMLSASLDSQRQRKAVSSWPISYVCNLKLQSMSYWEIDSYLAEEQTLQFSFTEDAEGMEFLDTSKGIIGRVPAESPLNAPIWLVSTIRDYIFKADGEVIKVEVPKFLHKDQVGFYASFQTDKRAKLENINLREKSPYFFEIYSSIHKILENNPNLIESELVQSIQSSRASSIIERASIHQLEANAESRFQNYTESERALFRTMRGKNNEYEKWECRKD